MMLWLMLKLSLCGSTINEPFPLTVQFMITSLQCMLYGVLDCGKVSWEWGYVNCINTFREIYLVLHRPRVDDDVMMTSSSTLDCVYIHCWLFDTNHNDQFNLYSISSSQLILDLFDLVDSLILITPLRSRVRGGRMLSLSWLSSDSATTT